MVCANSVSISSEVAHAHDINLLLTLAQRSAVSETMASKAMPRAALQMHVSAARLAHLYLIDLGGDGGAGDDPGVAAPERGGHLRGHAGRLRHQLRLIQHDPPEPKLQQQRPAQAPGHAWVKPVMGL